MTTLRDMVKHLQQMASKEYTVQGFESRVEIGPQTETEQTKTTINRVVVATYPSPRVVTRASQEKANLLITYRPLFPWAIDRLGGMDLIRIRLLAKNYISTYVMGSPWIAAKNGITEALAEILDLPIIREFFVIGDYSTNVPLGRVCRTNMKMNHSRLVNHIAGKLAVENILFTGNLDSRVDEILVVSGSLLDMPEIIEAKRQNILTIITGELSPDIRILASEEGLNVLEVGAFVSEEPGMRRLRNYLALEFPELKVEFAKYEEITKVLRPYRDTLT